ncbi:NETI motif-containing protein [Amphibacillus marinus]|uniref:NETI motif-containing protein n=1 Tax=Amphibacillus marinus TaxID=872970 RepID=UPI000B879424|nr:NETI motif-containing protein [Amphibacillus marinus]
MLNETIEECLVRIKQAGFMPIRKIEKPIFKEMTEKGQVTYQPVGRQVIFEVVPSKDER